MAPQLDKNRIAIRERNLLEILDLALMVLRSHGFPLVLAFLAGVVPVILLNNWLISVFELADPDYWQFDEQWEAPLNFLSFMGLLIYMEIPLAAAPATLYLGQSMFQETPGARQVARDVLRSLPQIFCFQFLLRGACLFFWFILLLPPLIPYIAWPYLNEVILLERNPLRAGRERQLTTTRRARRLMGPSIGDLIARWIGSVLVAILLVLSIWLAMWSFLSMLTGFWHSTITSITIYLPLAVWIVSCYFTVVRFLCYLDLRIRCEGWEVELAVRAEAAKLMRQPA